MKTTRRDFLELMGIGALSTPVINGHLRKSGSEEDFWRELRAAFPLTKDRVYLNNGTFGPSPQVVLDTMKENFTKSNTSGEYGHTDEARASLAAFVGVTKEEISLTHNTTEGINIVCWGIPMQHGDEVIISLHEHVGNALPWLNRAKLDGIVLRTFEPGKTAAETLDRIKLLINPKTKVIAVPHITCTLGQVFPIKEIASLANKYGILTAIDGAHGPGTFDLDLKDLSCDFYASSCHKWMLGPNGTGFVYIKKERLEFLRAIQVGAYSDDGWDLYEQPPLLKGYNPTAHRFDYGSQSMPLYSGAAEAAHFHAKIGKKKIELRVKELNDYLLEGLQSMSSHLDVLTPEERISRIAMLTFKHKQKEYRSLANEISKEGFRIRVVPESHLDAIRISTHIYNSKVEIDRFIMALEKHA